MNNINDEKLLPDFNKEINLNSPIQNQISSNSNEIKTKNFKTLGGMSVSTIHKKNNTVTTNTISLTVNSIEKLNQMIVIGDNVNISVFNENDLITKFVYPRRNPNYHFFSKHRDYCIIKCENISTFLVVNLIFSQFTNLNNLENETQIKSIFLVRKNKFNLGQEFKIKLQNKKMFYKENFMNKLEDFISGINIMFDTEEYLILLKNQKNTKIKNYFISIFIFLILILISVILIIFDFFKDYEYFWICFLSFIIVEFLLFLIFINSLIKVFVVLEDVNYFDLMQFYINNYVSVETYFKNWNLELFLKEGIFVSAPVTLDYIQFNFNPYQDVELEHHEIN